MAKSPSRPFGRGGCMPLGFTCLATCVLLALNAALINTFLDVIVNVFPAWLHRPKFEQALAFVLPVVVTVVQWWIVDWLFFHARDRILEIDESKDPSN